VIDSSVQILLNILITDASLYNVMNTENWINNAAIN